jgi:hypothetical protein
MVYSLGLFSADANLFIDQPFTNDFPRADIHKLISPDLLHQVIKGTFKDHLVTWVQDYLVAMHGATRAKDIMDDIDHRCVLLHIQDRIITDTTCQALP